MLGNASERIRHRGKGVKGMEKITVAQVAEDLGIEARTVYNMAWRGMLPFMTPTNPKDEKSRANFVVYPNLYKLFVTGFDSPKDTAVILFIFSNIMKELQELKEHYVKRGA